MTTNHTGPWQYSRWRHGGWYVSNIRYPSGASGCVPNNYPDKKWRIACDPRPFEQQPTFKTRDDAAQGEFELVARERLIAAAPDLLEALRGLLENAPAPKHIRDDFSYTLYREAARTAIAKATG